MKIANPSDIKTAFTALGIEAQTGSETPRHAQACLVYVEDQYTGKHFRLTRQQARVLANELLVIADNMDALARLK